MQRDILNLLTDLIIIRPNHVLRTDYELDILCTQTHHNIRNIVL